MSLLSSLDFRSTVTAQQLGRLGEKFLKAHRPEECPVEVQENGLSACMMAASVPLYVAHASGGCAYPIRPEIILHPCDCWSAINADPAMAVSSSSPRACVTSRLNFSVMVEISLSELTEARKALGLRPMAGKDLSAAVQQNHSRRGRNGYHSDQRRNPTSSFGNAVMRPRGRSTQW